VILVDKMLKSKLKNEDHVNLKNFIRDIDVVIQKKGIFEAILMLAAITFITFFEKMLQITKLNKIISI
jgi:hypothetical protein